MDELSIFDYLKTPLKIDKPIRLIEMFAGVGSQAKALERLGADFEHYKISEWEVNATASYKAVHKGDDTTDYSAEFTADELTDILFNIGISTDGKKPLSLKEIARKGEPWKRTVYNNFKATNNIGSILNVKGEDLGIVDTDRYTYILTYSFPCQDLSLAGKGKGMAKDSGTRSGLLWEVERLLTECNELPQILLMENVTQVHGSKNKEHFDEWIRFLESKGYSNYWQDLNAKNFGIPQNRNRTFMVSVLGDYTYKFPKEFPLELRLKDMLEDSVDEKFYLSGKMINFFKENTKRQQEKGNGFKFQPTDGECVGKAITTRASGRMDDNFIEEQPTCEQAGVLSGGKWDKMHDVSRRVYSEDGIAPTLHTCGGGNTEPKVLAGIGEKKSNGGTQWYQQDRIYDDKVAISVTTAFNPYYAVAMRGRLNENGEYEQNVELSDREVSNAVTTVQKDSLVAQAPTINIVGNYSPSNHDASRIVDTDGISHTVKENHGTVTGIVEPCIIEDFYANREERVFEGVAPTLRSERSGLKVAEPLAYDEQNQYLRTDGTVGTLTTDGSSPKHNNRVVEPQSNLRIRKLTPKECWRLMGFDDADFDKAAEVNSNSQLYKQAGNSIVVDVLYYIFREML